MTRDELREACERLTAEICEAEACGDAVAVTALLGEKRDLLRGYYDEEATA